MKSKITLGNKELPYFEVSINIMHIDDDKELLELSKLFLEQFDDRFHVETLNDPVKALEILDCEIFDVIICDYKMKPLSGIEVLSILRNKNNDCPFIMFTGKSREEIAIQALNQGADYYLQKGLDTHVVFSELTNFIRNAFEKSWEKKQRQLREREIIESEKEKQLILDSLSEHVVYQTLDGKILWANKAAARSVQKKQHELTGKYCFEIWSNLHERCLDCPVEVAIQHDIVSETEKQTPDGRFWHIQGTPVKNDNGKIIAAVETTLEITDRKHKEIELSEFAHFVFHDINNSLATTEGYCELLRKKYEEKHIDQVLKQIKFMKKTLKRSLELADAGLKEKPVELDLNEVVEEIAEVTIPETIYFKHDNLPTVLCGREKATKIFKNIFENAVIHGNPKTIKIAVKNDSKNTHTILSIMNDGKPIEVFIKEEFLSNNIKGYGLRIVKKTADTLGWDVDIKIKDNVDFKTSIDISIPKHQQKSKYLQT